jgi:hypothetical protein
MGEKFNASEAIKMNQKSVSNWIRSETNPSSVMGEHVLTVKDDTLVQNRDEQMSDSTRLPCVTVAGCLASLNRMRGPVRIMKGLGQGNGTTVISHFLFTLHAVM